MGKNDRPRLGLPGSKNPEPPRRDHDGSAPSETSVPDETVSLGDIVIVKTAAAISGQFEHAATVTYVYDAETVDVLLMPRATESYPVPRVSKSGSISWRLR